MVVPRGRTVLRVSREAVRLLGRPAGRGAPPHVTAAGGARRALRAFSRGAGRRRGHAAPPGAPVPRGRHGVPRLRAPVSARGRARSRSRRTPGSGRVAPLLRRRDRLRRAERSGPRDRQRVRPHPGRGAPPGDASRRGARVARPRGFPRVVVRALAGGASVAPSLGGRAGGARRRPRDPARGVPRVGGARQGAHPRRRRLRNLHLQPLRHDLPRLGRVALRGASAREPGAVCGLPAAAGRGGALVVARALPQARPRRLGRDAAHQGDAPPRCDARGRSRAPRGAPPQRRIARRTS